MGSGTEDHGEAGPKTAPTTFLRNAMSAVALMLAAVSLTYLVLEHHLFATEPLLIAVQAGAVALMVWARVTFGRRSFHATASTSAGGLVTSGPYRYWRHPIYASIIYFAWAGQVRSPDGLALTAAGLVTVSLFVRMLLEESFLRVAYPEYDEYSRCAKRFVPLVV